MLVLLAKNTMSASPPDTSDSSDESDNEGEIHSSPIKPTSENNPTTVRIEPLQIEIHSNHSFSIYKKISVTLLILVSFLFFLTENGLGIISTRRESKVTDISSFLTQRENFCDR